jgi:tRNA nucleotidyltransferase (CCA-adding enzyme)
MGQMLIGWSEPQQPISVRTADTVAAAAGCEVFVMVSAGDEGERSVTVGQCGKDNWETIRLSSAEDMQTAVEEKLGAFLWPVQVSQLIRPALSLTASDTLGKAAKLLVKSPGGVPVVEQGKLTGWMGAGEFIRAQERAADEDGIGPFVERRCVALRSTAKLDEAADLFLETGRGALPVVGESGQLLGVMDCLTLWRYTRAAGLGRQSHVSPPKYGVLDRLDRGLTGLLLLIGQTAEHMGSHVYLVGGLVRDLILERTSTSMDVDVVVEPEAIPLAEQVAKLLNGDVERHEQFRTATLRVPGRPSIDFVTCRQETYAAPGSLPDVATGSIKQDLFRRDFTVNTLAVCLNGPRYGELLDFFGGVRDLQNGTIRTLYELSFADDPTRILRAFRFAARLDFALAPETWRDMQRAVDRGVLSEVSGMRLAREIRLTLAEPRGLYALLGLRRAGILARLLPGLNLPSDFLDDILALERAATLVERSGLASPDKPFCFLLLLWRYLPHGERGDLAESWQFSRQEREMVDKLGFLDGAVNRLGAGSEREMLSVIDELAPSRNPELLVLALSLLSSVRMADVLPLVAAVVDPTSQPALRGNDIIGLGVKPGPIISKLLGELRAERMAGAVQTAEEEIEFVRRRLAQSEGEAT